jgi:nicotinic acid phosphoribosyltransferase
MVTQKEMTVKQSQIAKGAKRVDRNRRRERLAEFGDRRRHSGKQ